MAAAEKNFVPATQPFVTEGGADRDDRPKRSELKFEHVPYSAA